MYYKRGLSNIVATILSIFIIVTGASIIGITTYNFTQDSVEDLDDSYLKELDIITSEGYTYYDSDNNILALHIKRLNEENKISKIKINLFL